MELRLFVIACLLAMLCGCTVNQQMLQGQMLNSTRIMNLLDAAEANGSAPLPGLTPCACMYCDKQLEKTLFDGTVVRLPWPFSANSESSLYTGRCYFEECNSTTFAEDLRRLAQDPGTIAKIPRFFGYGQGGSFLEFGESLKYCNQSIGYAGKWMIGAAGAAPQVPSKRRAQCMLENNVIPVYIYYTNGSNINEARAEEIAQTLSGVGPAIVSTEIGFEPTQANLNAVARQVRAIKGNCPNCLVALSPRIGDLASIDAVLSNLTNPAVGDKVDMVGQGIILNDNPKSCDLEQLIGEKILFSRKVLVRHGKPTIWLYFGISPQTRNESAGRMCTWTPLDVAEAYSFLFQSTQPMASTGIIGVLNYQYADGLDPLPCEGSACDFGLVSIDSATQAVQKLPQFRGWFEGCQDYIGMGAKGQGTQSPVVFSRNGKGAACTFGANYRLLQGPVSIGNVQSPYSSQPMENGTIGYQCRACISYDVSPPSLLAASPASVNQSWCTEYYPVLDASPDRYDIDPVLMRAIIATESEFRNCGDAISYVPDTPTYQNACNPLALKDDSELIDVGDGRPLVDGACPGLSIEREYYDSSLSGPTESDCFVQSHFTNGETLADCKPCAMGLAQCTNYPGWVYAARSLPMEPEVKLCGGEKYNPFNATGSFCCGAYKISAFYSAARNFVENSPEIGYQPNQKEWYTAYIATQMYHDGGRTMGSDYNIYLSQRSLQPSGNCAGNQNYVGYLRNCLGRSYAYNVLSKYRALMQYDKCKGTNECKS